MDIPAERTVDARYLEPPQPFVDTMEMLATLQPGEEMLLLLFREPHPLYRVLQQNGHRWRTELRDDGTFAVRITC
ncbi:MAG TPA: DUF2249 domain-containing protein [Thiomonas arsenitoxydans]|mgnify:FL=1|jgi:uncharacterized protein (DUF2249 family)|uniref:DUF2249 domain-containing protein n=1 Tax=Azonexus caeni TaxID=266126 RepID=UPI002C1DFBE6|nr:DUF2249 domain-containing protein [Thiomonas arsenitoxydans]